jgi:hypothetical protein
MGAAIESLKKAINECPDEYWGDLSHHTEFWYMAYHTIFFLDFYFTESREDFTPPPPYTLSELDPKGVLPDRVYSKEELLSYLDYSRDKFLKVIESLTDEKADMPSGFGSLDISLAELIIYSTRHVQHHAAQMNLILRQKTDSAPRWVSKVD